MSTLKEKNPKDLNNISEENKTRLEKLGYDDWFEIKSTEYINDGFSIARIVEVNKNNYKVNDGNNEVFAELSGKFLFTIENNIDYPTCCTILIPQKIPNLFRLPLQLHHTFETVSFFNTCGRNH